jgi:sugar lactone lactonase YvrE
MSTRVKLSYSKKGILPRCLLIVAILSSLFFALIFQPPAHAWDRSHATQFAVLPQGSAHPEGITVDSKGNFYVTTWDYDHPGHPGHMVVFAPDGQFLRRVEVAGTSNLLCEVRFHPETGDLLIADFGGKQVVKVDPMTGASSMFISIPGERFLSKAPRETWATPNGISFDKKGNIYVTDSFQGTVWRTGPAGGPATPWVKSDLLLSHGYPSLGANGLAFDRAETFLFVANTGDDRIIRVPVVNGEAGNPEIFINGVNGPDGMFFDEEDRLWVVANQSDEIVVFDKTGKVVAKLGDFDGLDDRGAPRGLLFPAGMEKIGDTLYVLNLAVDGRYWKKFAPNVISQWAGLVKVHNIMQIPVPPLPKAENAKKEECVTLVKKAAKWINENGFDAGFAEINDRKGKFVTKDTYVFLMDLDGHLLAHPFNSQYIGKSLSESRDTNGKLYIQECITIAKSKGEGWTEYMHPTPEEMQKPTPWKEKKSSKKINFVYRVPGKDLVVVAGFFE